MGVRRADRARDLAEEKGRRDRSDLQKAEEDFRRAMESCRSQVPSGSVFIGLQFGQPGIVNDWPFVSKMVRDRGLGVRLEQVALSSGEDPLPWAREIAVEYAQAGFQGNLGITLGVVSRRRAEELYAMERLAEELHRVHPGLFVSFIFSFEERLREEQVLTRRPVPSYSAWFSAWVSDPVPGLMPVLPGVVLPPELWRAFEERLNSQAGLEQAA